jgi:hypothetical protein
MFLFNTIKLEIISRRKAKMEDSRKAAAVDALLGLSETDWPEVVTLAMGRRVAEATLEAALAAQAQAGGGL